MISMTAQTANQSKFRMPAEWEPHDAIWLAWPYDQIDFPAGPEKAEKVYVEMVAAVHTSERVELLVMDETMKQRASKMLAEKNVDLSQINFRMMNYTSFWLRDIAPTFVYESTPSSGSQENQQIFLGGPSSPPVLSDGIGGEREGVLVGVKWKFNSWSNKYPEFLKDNQVGSDICKELGIKVNEPGIVMEGGSFDVNGSGSLLTTEQCLLNSNRNPGLPRAEIENYLKKYLGVSNIIWLKEGIVGDDTDGHVDDIARFVNQHTVVAAFEENKADENYSILKENYDILTKAKDEQGSGLNVIKLPMPRKITDDTGRRLPASYLNFYIGNTVVLVPTFNDSQDATALEIIQKCFPERKVVGIYAEDLVFALGTFHCATQQQPRLPSSKRVTSP